MGSGAGAAREAVDWLSDAAASGWACCRCGCSGRSRPRTCWRRCPRRSRAIAVLDRTKEPGATGRAALPGRGHGAGRGRGRGRAGRMPRVVGGRYGLSSKEFTPAMVQGGVRRARRAPAPRNHFTVGITDDVSRHEPAGGRVVRAPSPTRCSARCSSAWAPTARSAPTRTPSRSSARIRTSTCRRYFVYDSKKSGSHDGVAPALRARADSIHLPRARRRSSSAATSSRSSRSSTCWAWPRRRRHAAAQQPVRAHARCGTTCRARVQEQISQKHIRLWVIDADRVARDAGPRLARQHRAADVLLRGLRRAAARAGASRRSRRPSRRPTRGRARRSCGRTSRPWTGRWRRSTR